MNIKSLLIGLAVSFLSVGTFGAELPSAEALFERHGKLVHGDADPDDYSITLSGTLALEAFNVEGPVTVKYKAPRKYSITMELMGSEIIRGCANDICWAQEFGKEMTLLDGEELELRLEMADVFRSMHMERYYDSMETEGLVEFGGEAAYWVKLVKADGRESYTLFSKDSGLIVGTHKSIPTPQGELEVTRFLSNYQQHGPFKLALEHFEASTQSQSRTVFTDVSLREISDDAFSPPPEIQALLKGGSRR